MSNKINTQYPIVPLQPKKVQQKSSPSGVNDFRTTFLDELNKQQPLKFSAHAQKRLLERNIELGEADIKELEKAVEKAEAKGARESLLLYGDLALITSIKNKTVVTAVDSESMQEHVFTNIDSALIVKKPN